MRKEDATSLLRSSSVPLWTQLSDLLRHQIHTGVLQPGSRVPTEPELGATYGVSRITVRAAIERLLAEQLVVRAQGKGTFVTAAVVRQDLSDLAGIIPNLESQGIPFQTRLVFFDHAAAPSKIASALGIGSEPVMQFRRLYEMGGKPLGLCETWIPNAAAITRERAEQAPCYTILSRYLDRPVASARLVIRVRRPDRAVARLLETTRNASLLCLERISLTATSDVCEFTCFWVRPDQYEFGLGVNGPMPIATGIVRAT